MGTPQSGRLSTRAVVRIWLAVMCALLVPEPCRTSADPVQEPGFYFVHMTDTHWGEGDNLRRTAAVVSAINALPMDIACVVHTGDITMDRLGDPGLVASGLGELEKLKAPVHFAAGNHDIRRRGYDRSKEIWEGYFGPLITETQHHGVVFITIYTGPLADDFTDTAFSPLEELEAALKRAGNQPVIVCHHTPSVDDFYRNKFHGGWKKSFQDTWASLLNTYSVKAVLAGHFHRDEFHWIGRVPLYVSSSVAGSWGRQASFRIFEYRDGKLGYSTQYVD